MPKVIIAEDDLVVADMLEEALVTSGYEVCGIARTVAKAVELGERHKPDLAVLNIRLADGGQGTDIPARLNSQGRMGVLYASGHIGQMSLTRTDGEALIVKPYRTEDVVRALHIVEQIVSTSTASRLLPKGFSILSDAPKGDAAPNASDASLAEQNQLLRRRQSELARFAAFAVVCRDLNRVLAEGARVCAECMRVPYCTIYRYRLEENDLLVVAGFGWDHGIIGQVSSKVDGNTPHGRAFTTGAPLICSDFSTDASFIRPRIYTEHGVISTLDVLIPSGSQPAGMPGALENLPYGVLEIGSSAQHSYDHQDAEFLSSVANILAAAAGAMKRDVALQAAADRLQDAIDDRRRLSQVRDSLLAEKIRLTNEQRVLVEDVQHRMRSNFQLVYTMLDKQLQATSDPAGTQDLIAISRRIMTLVQLYDHVIGTGLRWTINFSTYLAAICSDVGLQERSQLSRVKLTCHAESVILDLDSATALGLVVSELLANNYVRGRPGNTSTISVSLHCERSDNVATIIVADDGIDSTAPRNDEQHNVDVVKRLVEQAGGSATFRSDRGGEWTIKFPVLADPKSAPRYGLRESDIAEVNVVIAIVDDDAAVRDSLRLLLEIAGHTVATFGSAAEFLKAEKQNMACLILDQHMPGMNGLELAERLRADGSDLPILLITGSPSAAITERAAELGINRVLEKPPLDEDLLGFIKATRRHDYRGYHISIMRHGHRWRAMIYAPDSEQPMLGPQPDDPTDHNGTLDKAKALVDALLSP